MWRSAFVGLVVAVLVISVWRSAAGQDNDAARIAQLEKRVANLEIHQETLAQQVDANAPRVAPPLLS